MGRHWKDRCIVATTEAISMFDEQVIGATAVTEGMRVLVKDQPDARTNGIKVVRRSAVWDPAPDFRSQADISRGATIPVLFGEDGEPGPRYYQLVSTLGAVYGVDDMVFELASDPGGAGGPGNFDPSDVARVNGVIVVDKNTTVTPVNQTGSYAAPYDSIADALALMLTFASLSRWMVHVAPGTIGGYSESLGFNIVGRSITVEAEGRDTFALTGDHTITRSNNGYTATFKNVGFDGTSDFVVHDHASLDGTPDEFVFIDCQRVSLAPNAGVTAPYRVICSSTTPPLEQTSSYRMSVYDMRSLGDLLCSNVVLGDGSGKTIRGLNLIELHDCIVRAGATIQLDGSSSQKIRMFNCRFEGGATITPGSGGVVEMDRATWHSWKTAGGTRTLTNGTIVVMEGGVALGDANATITVSQGSHRAIYPNTLTANRDYTASLTGAVNTETLIIDRFDNSAFDAALTNDGPSGGTIVMLPGFRYVLQCDTGNWYPVEVRRL